MNKIFDINLGGIAFQIDDNAYDTLTVYLATIKKHFSNTVGHEEILDDIENRLAEMFSEKMKNAKRIISMADVEEAITIMGKPEQMTDGENITDETQQKTNDTNKQSNEHWYQRRLYRNSDDKVLGGVCAGLGAALGINPVWIRLAFACSILLLGTGALLYIILWIIIPEAKSATEKLEMQGEPININNIGKQIQQDAKAFGEHMKKWGEELKTTVKQYAYQQKASTEKQKPKRKNIFVMLFRGIIRLIVIILRIVFLLILFAFIMIILRGLGWEALGNYPYELDKIFADSTQSKIILISLFVTLAISITIGIITLLKYIFRFKLNHTPLKYIRGVIITVTLIVLLLVAGIISNDFSVQGKVHTEIPITTKNNKLYINLLHNTSEDEVDEQFIADRTITLNIEPSLDSNFHLEKYSYARASKRYKAEIIAEKTILPIVQHDSIIEISQYFNWLPANKWRAQFVELNLKVPKGKTIYMHEDVLYHININLMHSNIKDIMAFTGQYAQYTTNDNEIICVNKDTSISKRKGIIYPIDLENINGVKAWGNFQLNIVYGNSPELYTIISNKNKFHFYKRRNILYILERRKHFGPLTIQGDYHTEKITLVLPKLIEEDIDDRIDVNIDPKLKED